jgi:hypothetical protein
MASVPALVMTNPAHLKTRQGTVLRSSTWQEKGAGLKVKQNAAAGKGRSFWQMQEQTKMSKSILKPVGASPPKNIFHFEEDRFATSHFAPVPEVASNA